jgi:lysozyme family protein
VSILNQILEAAGRKTEQPVQPVQQKHNLLSSLVAAGRAAQQGPTPPLKHPETTVTPNATKAALDYIQEIEGDIVNDPDDAGGYTRYGVTQKAWEAYSDEDFETVDRTKARQFFHDEYIKAPGIHQLPDKLGVMMASLSVNAGPAQAIRTLQRAAGVEVDGHLGPKTLAAVEKVDAAKLKAEVDKFYEKTAKRGNNKKFLKGWLRRSREVFERAEAMEDDK